MIEILLLIFPNKTKVILEKIENINRMSDFKGEIILNFMCKKSNI